MPETVNRKYPYPVQTDAAQVPNHLRQPLEKVDADVQGLLDEVGTRVKGLGVTTLWVGTQDEYNALSPDPRTLYVISNATAAPPPVAQALGTPATTSLDTSAATTIVPTLPQLAQHWGYLAIIVAQNPIARTAWVTPTGWRKLTDQSVVDEGYSARPMAVFAAPAGTSTMPFTAPSGGNQRYVAAVYPILKEPYLRGIAPTTNGGVDAMVGPAMIYSGPSITITVGTTNYGDVSGAALPRMSLAQVNIGSGSALTTGQGNVTMLHAHVLSGLSMAATSQGYSVDQPMASSMSGWRLGIGYV